MRSEADRGNVAAEPAPRLVGRYAVYGEIAAGGMAAVHYGRLFGTAGFSRTVAIKRLHPQLAKDPDFVAMFLDEAHVAARIRHPNVVPTLDVVSTQGEIFIVMEYVHGESLWRLLGIRGGAPGQPVPPRIASAVVANVLHGLHAAHEATSEAGEPLGIVHRDVSPQNVLVGRDGVARVLDFGIAKARDRMHVTRGGQLRGKVSYMAPEQLAGEGADRRTDVYAAGVVLWEALTGRKLFVADGDFATADKVKQARVDPPSAVQAGLPAAIDALVLRAVARSPGDRYATANEMAIALEREIGIALPSEVGSWVETLAGSVLAERARVLTRIERSAPEQPAADAIATADVDPDPDGLAPTRALDVALTGGATDASLSVSGDPHRGGSRRLHWTIPVSALTALLVAAVGAVWIRSTHHAPSTSAALAASAAAPAADAAGSSQAAATVSATPEPSASHEAPAVAASAPAKAPRHVARNPCEPPYVIDSKGVRRLKPECLR